MDGFEKRIWINGFDKNVKKWKTCCVLDDTSVGVTC